MSEALAEAVNRLAAVLEAEHTERESWQRKLDSTAPPPPTPPASHEAPLRAFWWGWMAALVVLLLLRMARARWRSAADEAHATITARDENVKEKTHSAVLS